MCWGEILPNLSLDEEDLETASSSTYQHHVQPLIPLVHAYGLMEIIVNVTETVLTTKGSMEGSSSFATIIDCEEASSPRLFQQKQPGPVLVT